MSSRRNRFLLVFVLVYILLAAADFLPFDVPAKMTFPLLWLSLAALWQRQWALASALFCSFLGDVMGWKGELIPQIGFFALAQFLYIIIYIRLFPLSPSWSRPVIVAIAVLLAAVYGVAMMWIFPRVKDAFISYGIAVYAVLLLAMCFSASRHRSVCLILGALLFVASDFILGVHLFVERIPHAHQSIMVPYYLGQLLLFLGTLGLQRKQNRKGMHRLGTPLFV